MEKKKSKKLLFIFLAIGVVILIAVIVLFLNGNKNSSYRVIKIESYEGIVSLQRDAEDKDVIEGMNLQPQDGVATGEASLVGLLADSDKHILAKENSCFTIDSVGTEKKGKITIHLEYGSALIEIENKLPEGSEFEVTTPNATVSVRGTSFEVTYDAVTGLTTVKVIDGVVDVTSATETQNIDVNNMVAVTDNDGEIVPLASSDPDGTMKLEVPNYTEDVMFYVTPSVKSVEMNASVQVGVKNLLGWTYLHEEPENMQLDTFTLDTVELMYNLENQSGYEVNLHFYESYCEYEGFHYEVNNVTNSDGEPITLVSCVSDDGSQVIGYTLYKMIAEDQYVMIGIHGNTGAVNLATTIDIDSFIEITRDCYYSY